MKDKSNRKGHIISIRMSDEERDEVQKLMDSKNKKASSIMREALTLFREQWELSRRLENPVEN
jgi:predicted transcriptional regulator